MVVWENAGKNFIDIITYMYVLLRIMYIEHPVCAAMGRKISPSRYSYIMYRSAGSQLSSIIYIIPYNREVRLYSILSSTITHGTHAWE